jgi:phospholipid/cholesterol/gamma-HCH transport system permease protein
VFYPKTIVVIAVFMGFSLLLHGIKHITIKGQTGMIIHNWLVTFGKYLLLMGRSFSRPERFRMFWKRYVTEMAQLGINSIGIVLLISFFIGAVICIQMKLNIQSPWMPRWVSGYTTREILLLEFSSSIMCLILAGKVGSNIASELGTMRVTQQIDALEIMGVNSAAYLILPKVLGFITIMPFLVIFSSATGILGAYATAYIGQVLTPEDLTAGLQHSFNPWFMWMSIIKSLFFAYIISSVSSYFGYSVEGGSVEVGKASTAAVVNSSVLILFSDVFLTQLLS